MGDYRYRIWQPELLLMPTEINMVGAGQERKETFWRWTSITWEEFGGCGCGEKQYKELNLTFKCSLDELRDGDRTVAIINLGMLAVMLLTVEKSRKAKD